MAQAALRAPPEEVFAMRSWPLLTLTFALLFTVGPGGFCGCEAGHCFNLLFFGRGGLLVPPVVADESISGQCFHLLFFPSFFLSTSFAFHPLQGNSETFFL